MPRLDIGRRSPGWATWETWFDAHRCEAPQAPVETYENYFHLLRAASDGDGVAIGWNAFVGEHFRQGSLVAVCGVGIARRVPGTPARLAESAEAPTLNAIDALSVSGTLPARAAMTSISASPASTPGLATRPT